VLKPGGHILAFGGSRTWHRLAVAVEDAGFELRDSIAWIYGSGFPKSLDVSKAIDKNNGEAGRKLKFTAWMRTTGLTASDIERITGTNMGGHYLTAKSQPAIPTVALWEMLRPHCGEIPAWVDELVARVEAEREVIGQTTKARSTSGKSALPTVGGTTVYETWDETSPATPEAKQWEGWGTALKPAHEPIVVGRKPFGKGVTVAENVLAWGVGGLNIDGSRIGSEKIQTNRYTTKGDMTSFHGSQSGNEYASSVHQGRWPANVILDEVTAGLLDEQSGERGASAKASGATLTGASTSHSRGKFNGVEDSPFYGDSGGASRFFYVAKASKRDRNEGLEELEAVRTGAMQATADGSMLTGSGNKRTTARQNFHPTVKPTALMRYLIKLVTPPGGTVLDPFTGSGSTGKAALLDGFDFVGVELTEEYLPIIEGRLRWASEQVDEDDTLF
jgi:hypothetical protein